MRLSLRHVPSNVIRPVHPAIVEQEQPSPPKASTSPLCALEGHWFPIASASTAPQSPAFYTVRDRITFLDVATARAG